jgi:integrase/recombinase XerD
MKIHAPENPQQILDSFEHQLRQVSGLSSSTCQNRRRDVAAFLEAVPIRKAAELADLSASDLTGYLSARSVDYAPASLRQVAGSLRQFLRFTQQQGWTEASLSLAVPGIAARTPQDLPTYLTESQLNTLLASYDRSSAQGQRDLGITLCLARLGLRAGEVASLLLEDIDWREGMLRLRQSKNLHQAQLPLLPEVGQALVSYLRAGRPPCHHRHVFLLHQPPRPMDRHAVSGVIQRALRHCGIQVPRPGAHLLRHTLASHLVQKGASLKEIADLLRHRHINSAAVYTHVDLPQLRTLAQPWPKEAVL